MRSSGPSKEGLCPVTIRGYLGTVRIVLPSSFSVLLFVGISDLILTSWLSSRGLIVEFNPLMRHLLQQGEATFVAVKALSLLVAWCVLAVHARRDRETVMRCCSVTVLAYLCFWSAAVAFG